MGRLSRKESQAATRAALIASARDLFIQKGFAGASVNEIAEAAGFSKGAFYANFETKEDIMIAVLEQHLAEEADVFEAMLPAGESDTPALDHLWARLSHLNVKADWATLAVELRLHAQRAPDFAAAFQKLNDKKQATFAALLEQLFVRCGKVAPLPYPALATAVMSLSLGQAVQQGSGAGSNGGTTAGETIAVFLKTMLDGATDLPTRMKE